METEKTQNTLEGLIALLKSHHIPVETWGSGKYKSAELLLDELNKGEAEIEEGEDGNILRTLKSVTVLITHMAENGEKLILREARQVFPDGTRRERYFLDGSVSGKISKDENPMDGARRELQEELGFKYDGPLTFLGTTDSTRVSESYPGLNSRYLLSIFGMEIPPQDFKPEGYVEIQDRITTYFEWRKTT